MLLVYKQKGGGKMLKKLSIFAALFVLLALPTMAVDTPEVEAPAAPEVNAPEEPLAPDAPSVDTPEAPELEVLDPQPQY